MTADAAFSWLFMPKARSTRSFDVNRASVSSMTFPSSRRKQSATSQSTPSPHTTQESLRYLLNAASTLPSFILPIHLSRQERKKERKKENPPTPPPTQTPHQPPHHQHALPSLRPPPHRITETPTPPHHCTETISLVLGLFLRYSSLIAIPFKIQPQ